MLIYKPAFDKKTASLRKSGRLMSKPILT